MAEVKSAIREVRDQLFLNRADGRYLSNVGANIGFERPQFGFHNDSLWRAIVRRGALDYRQIVNLFEDWLTVIFGPRITSVTILAEEAVALEETLVLLDPTNIPQRGTMIIDEGLATEQTFEYTFRNPETGLVELSSSISTSIPALAIKNASGYLRSAVVSGATSLPLVRSVDFPEADFPYPLLLSPGTPVEEIVQLTGHNPSTQTLSCTATVNDHSGPKATYTVASLEKVEGGGTVITLGDTSNFPATGIIRVKEPGIGGVEDVVPYFDNDVSANVLYLFTKLTNVFTLGAASVTLLRSQSKVQLAQVQVKGSSWDIFETEARKIKIFIPEDLTVNRLIDVTYVHDAVSGLPSSSLDAAASIGDTELKLQDASTFPSAGIIKIDSGGPNEEKIGYNRVDRFWTTMLGNPNKASGVIQTIAPGSLIDGETFTLDDGTNPAVTFEFDKPPDGVTLGNVAVDISAAANEAEVAIAIRNAINADPFEIYSWIDPTDDTKVLLANYNFGPSGNTTSSDTVANPSFTVSNMTGGSGGIPAGSTEIYVQDVTPIWAAAELTKDIFLSQGFGNEELVTWTRIDQVRNKITLLNPTVNEHSEGYSVTVSNPHVLHLTRGLTKSHILAETVELDEDAYPGTDLEIGDPTVAPVNAMRYQGSYQFSIPDRARDSQVATTLAEDLAGPVRLMVDQSAGCSALEVRDAILFDTTGQFDITVGRGKGAAEDIDVTGITFRRDAAGMVLTSAMVVGSTSFSMSTAHIALLPNPGGGAPMGFRLLIDKGGANEEVIVVEDHAGTTVSLLEPCTKIHAVSETVELMADVFELSELTVYDHMGLIPSSQRKAAIPASLRPDTQIHWIEEIRTSIQVAATTGFPSAGGYVLINFGRERVVVKNRLASALAAAGVSIVLDSSADLPTSGYPYFVEIDINTYLVERKGVTNNNPGTNTLTISPGADYDHPEGAEIRFDPGVPVTLLYSSLESAPDRLMFASGIRLTGSLLKGTSVILSSVTAKPSTDGFDYPFYLPSTWADRLQFLFDRGRAAGVEVVTISNR